MHKISVSLPGILKLIRSGACQRVLKGIPAAEIKATSAKVLDTALRRTPIVKLPVPTMPPVQTFNNIVKFLNPPTK